MTFPPKSRADFCRFYKDKALSGPKDQPIIVIGRNCFDPVGQLLVSAHLSRMIKMLASECQHQFDYRQMFYNTVVCVLQGENLH